MVRAFHGFLSERKKRTTSGGCPQFPKIFSGKLPFHLTSNRNFRIFWLNGKHPLSFGDRLCLGAYHFTLGGGGGGWVILEKNILQMNMRKKKIPAQDHHPKKNSCTYSGLEKKFWQDVPCADTVNFCISKLLKDFSIWTWVFI